MQPALSALIAAVHARCGRGPIELAIVLGSGLGGLVDQLEDPTVFAYRDFPCFPTQRVAGHEGRLILAWLDGVQVLLFQGRFHYYQGLSARQAALPVEISKALGIPRLLLTNAVGGINSGYHPGDFIYVSDHLNFLGDNPLRGETDNPFVDLGQLYQQTFYPELAEYAQSQGINLHRGVLAAMAGPSYETPAEIRALGLLGADAVTMSTIPEAILAHYLGLEVVALSLVSNVAAGRNTLALAHADVLAAGVAGASAMAKLARRLTALWLASSR